MAPLVGWHRSCCIRRRPVASTAAPTVAPRANRAAELRAAKMANNNYTSSDMKKDVKDAARETAEDVKAGASKLARDAKDAWNEATDNTTVDKVKQGAADIGMVPYDSWAGKKTG